MVTIDDNLIGLTEYEGRVYRALLAENPATAYRLGKHSGVPLSRVYEVAARLVEKGAASVLPGDPARYTPTPPDQLVAQARARAAHELDTLQAELSALYAPTHAEAHAWLQGEAAVLRRAQGIAAGAASEVQLACGADARIRLGDALAGLRSEVRVRRYNLLHSARDEAGFVLLVDNRTALIGRLGQQADALVTEHPMIVRVCADMFRLRSVAETAQEVISQPRARTQAWLDWEEEKQRRLMVIS